MDVRFWGFWGVALVLVTGCQGQEFLPVTPMTLQVRNVDVSVAAKQLPPNIMLVVDRSGSMTDPAEGTGPSCSLDGTPNSPYDPQSTASCKWNDLKGVLADPSSGFLVQSAALGQFGLLAFPGEPQGTCAAGTIEVPVGAPVQQIRFQLLNQLTPGGGTPTAQALLTAAQDPALAVAEANRRRFVILLTDGLPNCSSDSVQVQRCADCTANPAVCANDDGCRPTFGATNSCTPLPFAGAACLDEDGLVQAVQQIKSQGVETFVIGFGSDTSGSSAATVLNLAAAAGGHARTGATEQYYQANTVEELRTFLDQILRAFPCDFPLSPAPSNPDLVSVTLSDTSGGGSERILARGTDWEFASPNLEAIHLLGDVCNQVQNAPDDRYSLALSYAATIP